MRRILLLTLSFLLWSCTSAPKLPQANGQGGMLLIPTNYQSKTGRGRFVYSYIFNYSGPESGSEQIYAQLSTDYSLIGPLAPGEYTMDTMQLYGGSSGSAQASSHNIAPVKLGAPFEIKPNTVTVFCCALASTLENGNALDDSFSQWSGFLDTTEGEGLAAKQRAEQSIASEPGFKGWVIN